MFSDPEKLKILNQITHPLILEEVKEKQTFYSARNQPLVVVDVPLLFESKWDRICDGSLVISLDYQTQLKRLMKRNNFSELEAKKRIASQMPISEKIQLADYNINNGGNIEQLESQLADLLLKLNQ